MLKTIIKSTLAASIGLMTFGCSTDQKKNDEINVEKIISVA